MIIIGGVGTVLGSFLGSGVHHAAADTAQHDASRFSTRACACTSPSSVGSNLELMVFGGLIIFFLIVEPHGLARLWQIGKEKLRLWPFPH